MKAGSMMFLILLALCLASPVLGGKLLIMLRMALEASKLHPSIIPRQFGEIRQESNLIIESVVSQVISQKNASNDKTTYKRSYYIAHHFLRCN